MHRHTAHTEDGGGLPRRPTWPALVRRRRRRRRRRRIARVA
jgi:hypothetical protein